MNAKKPALRRVLFWLVQCSWGLLQTAAGAAVYALHRGCTRSWYRNARVTFWKRDAGLSLGGFLFLPAHRKELLTHEYGHCCQSLLLGPLFLPVVGLPSILWAGLPLMARLRKRRKLSYFDCFPENWANRLGERICGEKPPH